MEEPFLTPAITINQEQIGIFKLKSYIGQKHYIITKKLYMKKIINQKNLYYFSLCELSIITG